MIMDGIHTLQKERNSAFGIRKKILDKALADAEAALTIYRCDQERAAKLLANAFPTTY